MNDSRWPSLSRRAFLLLAPAIYVGCQSSANSSGDADKVWGEFGVTPGRFSKPRAMAIDSEDQLYIVDKTGRIQVFTCDGEYLRGWRTPEIYNGKPSGLSFDLEGNLLVADTHYFRMLVYTPQGELQEDRTIGGVNGFEPGQFNFVTDAVQDSQGNFYIGEYGENDRIQKFTSSGEFLLQWGGHGGEPGQFVRPQNMTIDEQDRLWVADACNHRIQVFDVQGEEPRLVKIWGEEGHAPGQMRYPYDLLLDHDDHLYVCEFGNHRVQKFTRDGKSVGVWGERGRGVGQLHQPWAIAQDSRGRIHVLDTYNHRVQRFWL